MGKRWWRRSGKMNRCDSPVAPEVSEAKPMREKGKEIRGLIGYFGYFGLYIKVIEKRKGQRDVSV